MSQNKAISDDNIDWNLLDTSKLVEVHSDTLLYLEKYLKKGALVLDLGCQGGRFYPAFRRLGVIYEGIDFSPVAIEDARKHYPECNFYLGKA